MSKLRERVENRSTKNKSSVKIFSFLLRFGENCKRDKKRRSLHFSLFTFIYIVFIHLLNTLTLFKMLPLAAMQALYLVQLMLQPNTDLTDLMYYSFTSYPS